MLKNLKKYSNKLKMKLINLLNNKKFDTFLIIYGILIFSISVSGYLLKLFPHNTVANIMPAIATHLNIGIPYLDYWDVYPPGIYLFYYLFYYLGKDNFFAYNLLHIILLILTITFAKNIFSVVSKINILFYIALSYFLSPLFIHYLLPNELIGLFFSFFGLFIYLSKGNKLIYIALSNFLLFFAAFIKEIFLLPALCIIFYQLIKKEYKKIIYSLVGSVSVIIVLYIYISSFKLFDSLIESYIYKYDLFDIDTLLNENLFLIIISLCIFMFFLFPPKNIQYKINSLINREYVIYLYSLLMLVSYLFIGRDDGGHFDIPKIFALFLFLTILLNISTPKYKIFSLMFIILISGYFLKFQHAAYSYLLIRPDISTIEKSYLNKLDFEIIDEIENNKNGFLYLYGWDSPNFYYELKIKPYSRYWIVNTQIMTKEQILEFKQHIFKKAPGVIYYCGLNPDCPAGFNFIQFEKEYINFRKIIKDCYSEIGDNYYKLVDQSCLNTFEN